MRILDWNSLSIAERKSALRRPAQRDAAAIEAAVRGIVDEVRQHGDAALREFTQRFDGVSIERLAVSSAEFAAAERALDAEQHGAIDAAIGAVHAFHAAQGGASLRIETARGMRVERITIPLQAVGLYVPAGSAPLPSTAIMLAVPAALAQCPVRVMCTAPMRSGAADPAVLVAARKSGVEQVFKVGGAQAIAGMAYGTESIPKCDKLFGPGNAWVAAAKLVVAGDADGAAADLPAGVSEVMVVADHEARADFVAADLLAQAEHSSDAQSLLVTPSAQLAAEVAQRVEMQVRGLSRAAILKESVANIRLLVVDSMDTAMTIVNDYAPEHLLLQVQDPRRWLDRVTAAGSVFLGSWTPETLGDYCSGPNHTLPTYGYAKAYSGLGLEDFQKRMTVQEATPEGLENLASTARVLAGLEGLDAHAAAVTVRLEALQGDRRLREQPRPSAARAMNPVVALARPEIVSIKPYAHAAWLPTLTRLHANEAPWRPAGDSTDAGLNRYPEPQPQALIEGLARLYDVPSPCVLATRGSDEAIDLLSRIYLRAGSDAIMQCTPTFGMYQVAARIQGADVVEIPLDRARGWALDADRVLAAWRPTVKLVYLCSPNNPTANLLDRGALEAICTALTGKAIIVIDEAYIEWARASSLTGWLERFPTLAILRTLSKAHALAGARIGALLADPALIELAKRIIAPYALAQPTIETALRALNPASVAESQARRGALLEEREYLAQRLRSSSLVETVWPSDANFLLIDCYDAQRFLSRSIAGGSIVRDLRANPALPTSLRVSVGTRVQNDALLDSLEAA